MLREIRDKLGGWWRKLNQPLISELPVYVTWASFMYGIFCLCLFVLLNYHLSSASYNAMFEAEGAHINVSNIFAIIVIAFFVTMDAVLLFLPYKAGLHNLLLQWYVEREIKNFTKLKPLTMLFLTLVVGLFSFMIIPTMDWQYKALKNDEVLLSAMKDGNLSLENDWLEKHEIPMEQYAQRRQDILKEGWVATSERTKLYKKETFFLLAFFSVLLGGMILRTFVDIYFVWRYYPKAV